MDDVCKLVAKTFTTDSIGQRVEVESLTEVFTSVSSVSRNEFFDAGASGIRAQYVFSMAIINYSGENELEYVGKRYRVYRTYQTSNSVELYAEELTSDGGQNESQT